MEKRDLVIVGHGIAGSVIAQKALERGLSILVIDQGFELGSSWVAGGLMHPLVFKRLTLAWPGIPASLRALEFFENHGKSAWHPLPLYRRIGNPDEANRWVKSREDPELSSLLQGFGSSDIPEPRSLVEIAAPFGWGRVEKGGWLDVPKFLTESWGALEAQNRTLKYFLGPEEIDLGKPVLSLPDLGPVEFGALVLATGISAPGWKALPDLGSLPFYGVKGDVLDLWLPELGLDSIVLGPLFLVPLDEKGLIRVGSTYERDYKDSEPSLVQARAMVLQLREFVPRLQGWSLESLEERVRFHRAGIRPAARDRRPYLGPLGRDSGDGAGGLPPWIVVMNGLGARGCMVAPYAAEVLLDFIQFQKPIPEELGCTTRLGRTVT